MKLPNLKPQILNAFQGEKMNQRDRVVFDLKGYLVKPAVLNQAQVEHLKEFVLQQRNNPDSLPPHQRRLPGGPFAKLIDHPAVMKVLLEVINPDLEKIRLENIFLSYREPGEGEWKPHAGGLTTNPNYAYNFQHGRIYAGMTRVVWELTEVLPDKGELVLFLGATNLTTISAPIPLPVSMLEIRDFGKAIAVLQDL